jgi:hypothetical protein
MLSGTAEARTENIKTASIAPNVRYWKCDYGYMKGTQRQSGLTATEIVK